MTEISIPLHKPFYVYGQPMFMVTVSVVLVVENGIVLTKMPFVEEFRYSLPGGRVKAGQESVQFAAVRFTKEQTGLLLKKEDLMPVDFRSDPSRTEEGNVIDLGFVCMLNKSVDDLKLISFSEWMEVDFDQKNFIKKDILLHTDYCCHDQMLLIERAIDVLMIMKE